MELRPGQTLAGYEIIDHVKSGGMASLHLARRRGAAGFQRAVAIKVVHPHLARDKKFVQMFLDEARLAVRIQHPNVVRVEELLEAEGTYLMVMEYVHGCSLFELLRSLAREGRRLSPDLVAWIGAQIADGLHAAHELRDDQGRLLDVVHRDVSPQNVLLSYSGHVKVIDFGIAKSSARAEKTRVGVIRGKIGYMSPEQANAQNLDRRVDVYATGIVLWEMLTSRRLFRAENDIQLLDKVRRPRIPAPSMYGEVPEKLEEVVLAALRPDPGDRIPSGKELRDRLLAAHPPAGSVHSSMLAGLLATVMKEKLEDSPLGWTEAGLTGAPARPSTSFVQDHTRVATQASFTDPEEDEIELPPLPPPSSSRPGVRPIVTGAPPPPPRASSGPPPPPPRPSQGDAGVLVPFAEFQAPPEPGTESEAPKPVAAPAEPPRGAAGILVSLLWLLVGLLALGAAGYLAYLGFG